MRLSLLAALAFYLATVCFHERFSNSVYVPFREFCGHENTEYITAAGLCLLLATIVLFLRRHADFTAKGEPARWIVCLAAMACCVPLLMVTNIEIVHYVQYCVLVVLLRLAGFGEKSAYLLALSGSLCDEGRQYLLNPRFTGYFDWNDLVLNNLGAAVGLLACRRAPGPRPCDRAAGRAAAGLVAVIAIAVLCAWLAGRVVAHAPLPPDAAPTAFPVVEGRRVLALSLKAPFAEFWQLGERGRTYHILGISEGLIACAAAACLLWVLVRRRPGSGSPAASAVLTALLLALGPGMATPAVADAPRDVRQIHIAHSSAPPAIDGDLDDACWQGAAWLSDFQDIADAKAPVWLSTSVAFLWDEDCLYMAARLEEPWLEASVFEHDGMVYRDPDLEIFFAGRDAYWELEVNAAGTVYDIFWIWRDVLGDEARYPKSVWNEAARKTMRLKGIGEHVHPRGERVGYIDEDMPGLRMRVRRAGTLNANSDRDRGWTVEAAIPWKAFVLIADGRPIPPVAGEEWAMNVFRFVNRGQQGEPREKLLPAGWALAPHGVFDAHMPECFARAILDGEKPKP